MKKLMLFCVLALTMAVQAQKKITEKDLQGSWKLVSYTDGQVVINAEEGTFAFTKEYEASASPDELKKDKDFYMSEMGVYKSSTMTFKGKQLTFSALGESQEATFELNAAGTVMKVLPEGEEAEDANITFENGMLKVVAVEDDLVMKFRKI